MDENDPKYQEYMQLMQSNNKGKVWANETVVVNEEQPAPLPDQNDASEDEYEDLSKIDKTEKRKRRSSDSKKTRNASTEPSNEATEASSSKSGAVPADEDDEILPDAESPTLAAVSDMDWLKLRTNQNPEESLDPSTEQAEGEGEGGSNSEANGGNVSDEEMVDADSNDKAGRPYNRKSGEHDASVEKITQTGRLFLRNLSYTITEDDISELFDPFGEIEEVGNLACATLKPAPFQFIFSISTMMITSLDRDNCDITKIVLIDDDPNS